MPDAGRPRRILLADCDSYFVRCAQLADPEGAGRAELLIVGGRAEGRGVVTSASYAAREFGVRSGMPTAHALRLCPGATVVPVPGDVVRAKHREVRAVLDRFTPVVQAASVDEFYLDLTGTERLFHDEPLERTARRIQAAVLEETGIAVSLGGSTQRLLAKMAASEHKPMGVCIVPAGGEAAWMRGRALASIPGVGPSLQRTLERRGMRTVDDLLPLDEASLRAWLGDARGRWLYAVARGRDASEVRERAPQKSISHERTFSRDLLGDDEVEARLLALARETAASLRDADRRARTVTVRLREGDFTDRQASRTVAEPICSDRAVWTVARRLLRELRERRRTPVRLLGVGVSRLTGGEDEAPSLFPPADPLEDERDRALSSAADRVRARFGPDALRPARIVPPARADGDG